MADLRVAVEADVVKQREKVAALEAEAAEAAERAQEALVLASSAEARAIELAGAAARARAKLDEAESWLAESVEQAARSEWAEPEAHALWGGGRDLHWEDAAKVLELLEKLKEQAQVVAKRLVEQVDEQDDAGVADWAARVLLLGNLSVVPDEPKSPRGQGDPENVWIFGDEHSEPRCELTVPSRLAYPFMRTFAKLTGEFPDAAVFLRLLEMTGWESLEREDGGACGWTFRALDLRERANR
ncbi:unnamed protein product, partial [Prorocentrum cordatum]